MKKKEDSGKKFPSKTGTATNLGGLFLLRETGALLQPTREKKTGPIRPTVQRGKAII